MCFAGGLAASHWWKQKNAELDGTIAFASAKDLPNFEVINHSGETVGTDDLKGRWSLMFFGFTHCPDVCPNTLNALTQIQESLPKDKRPVLVLVSVDPMRDTPEIINKYINTFTDDIKAYTGELHQVQALTKDLGVAYAYNSMPDGSYTVDHTAAIFLITPDGKHIGTFTNMLNSQEDIDSLRGDYLKLYKRFEKRGH